MGGGPLTPPVSRSGHPSRVDVEERVRVEKTNWIPSRVDPSDIFFFLCVLNNHTRKMGVCGGGVVVRVERLVGSE